MKASRIKSSLEDDEGCRLEKLLVFEREARLSGYQCIAGVDEAGRGPLAGPVVAAACIIPENVLIAGINDSKKTPSRLRGQLFDVLTAHPEIRYGVGVVSPEEIDRVNIYQASIQAMCLAVENLVPKPDYLLVDGFQIPSLAIPNKGIVRGDALSYLIAAASIIAKEIRDKMMADYHEQWPAYGFNQHKGYATEKHRAALEKHGPCPIHRFTFEPVRSHHQRLLLKEDLN